MSRRTEIIQEEIVRERRRQIEEEGFTAEHDSQHGEDLMEAALCYQAHAFGRGEYSPQGVPRLWPWHRSWWKPQTRRRDLIRAGALCLAAHDKIVEAIRALPVE